MTQHFRTPTRTVAVGSLRPLALLCGFLLSAALTFAEPVKFDIPAQPTTDALQQFIKQSGASVMYSADLLGKVRSPEVKGELEPLEALQQLLAGTDFTVRKEGAASFVIVPASTKPGTIEGSVSEEKSSRPVVSARVTLAGTTQSALTDKRGRFFLDAVAPGDHALMILAEGMQDTKVTDVTVKAGHRLSLSAIAIPVKKEGPFQLEDYVVSAKKNDGVIELDPYSVEGRREKPFVSGNMDIPRTVNDAQPYYIFDAKSIDRSGATNIEDFLKQRLTMNTVSLQSGQASDTNVLGNTSSINLRGLGTDKTLILVNGRRVAGLSIVVAGNFRLDQPDINGIALSSIERIEVLPASASGIYGGSAVGGVINIVMKRNYSGGEIQLSYDNTWGTDSPRRRLSFNYGQSIEGGRTHLLLSASWSDAEPMLVRDRKEILQNNFGIIIKNSPAYFYSATSPVLGALPNITASSAAQTTLTLKDGTVIPTRITHVPAGTSTSTPKSVLFSGLAANSGSWNLDRPESTQPTGLLRPFGATPKIASFGLSVRRQMTDLWEIFAEASQSENKSTSLINSNTNVTVPASSPVNPFTTAVTVIVPDASIQRIATQSWNRSYNVGVIAQLPFDWIGELDISRSKSRYTYQFAANDSNARTADLANGTLNVFIDTLRFPISQEKYLGTVRYTGSSTLEDYSMRGAGPIAKLPWGSANLTIGIQHRIAERADAPLETRYNTSVNSSIIQKYYGGKQLTDSAYGEATIPLVKNKWLPFVHSFLLQLSGRSERYVVDTGTPLETTIISSGVKLYSLPPLVNGKPYFTKDRYSSTNGTVGIRYQPFPDLTFRASHATAFLPPLPTQLVKNPTPDTDMITVNDPVTGQTGIRVYTLSGGNPDLKPQTSKSLNAGMIWAPRAGFLRGLRVNLEYYNIDQYNAIGFLSAQQIIDSQGAYPERINRDGSGMITQVDISQMNLYRRTTEGCDISASYSLNTGLGTFNLAAAETYIFHHMQQVSLTAPDREYVDFPSAGGTIGAARYKGAINLDWEHRQWSAGWAFRYVSAYKQRGADGDPVTTIQTFVMAQGKDTIPFQAYHDIYVGYVFGKSIRAGHSRKGMGSKLLSDLTLQLGVRNVFNKVPPLDAFFSSNFYSSPYGDSRLRNYWIKVRKQF